ncbi:DUF1906 domain-containing protein [Peribacillus saganii]|uniref:DUF1906 domain-containing protein n=1 Tax=Peribacillus saganii TaxID=2303992 RepID=A0A372LQU6_9BACI|nr:glycoside hydrolase domain-containing protein [Peribacillus saganii]RFU70603.1 DUF1906 domain-containing protein [Peribacillus saganii]
MYIQQSNTVISEVINVSFLWGVDSALSVNQEILNCVTISYGKPLYWGRYLSRVEGAAEGLTRNEILFLHKNGIRVMPIYSNFRSAVGLRSGNITAQNAVAHARRLNIPEGKILFANIERFFQVDSAWIEGWFSTIRTSGYRCGYYHDPLIGEFNREFCEAVKNNEKIAIESILWSAEPETGATKQQNAPRFGPKTVNCQSNTWGWQYGRDATACPIDTNIINDKLYNFLY